MKFGDFRLEIPGSTDILFFKDISFETESPRLKLIGNTPQIWGRTSSYDMPQSGKMTIKFYTSDDLEWIRDWFNYVYFSCNRRNLPFYEMSNVAKAFFKRKIKLYNKNSLFVFYDTVPCEMQYDNGLISSSIGEITYDNEYIKPWGVPTYVEITLNYNWCERTFI